MRLAVLSDLHSAARLPEAVDAIAAAVDRQGAEWLLCAGDVGAGGGEDALRCLRALDAACAGRVLFVPGNHDVWCRPGTPGDSWDQWRRLLDFDGNLERGNRDLGEGLCAVGTGGWYDYSLGRPGPWSRRDTERKRWGDVVWNDAVFARWDAADGDVCHAFGRLLGQRLREAGPDRRVVALTHVLPFVEAVTPHPERPSWMFCQAFLGSAAYGDLLRERRCVLSVFGHTHVRRRGAARGIPYVCAPLGYEREWSGPGGVAAEVAEALALVDVPPDPVSRRRR